MKKPVEAIERMRELCGNCNRYWNEIAPYLDSIPDDAIPVVWPKELTRERLEEMARAPLAHHGPIVDALRALAAIAPQRKKRMVNLWRCESMDSAGCTNPLAYPVDWKPNQSGTWRKVAGPVEIDE